MSAHRLSLVLLTSFLTAPLHATPIHPESDLYTRNLDVDTISDPVSLPHHGHGFGPGPVIIKYTLDIPVHANLSQDWYGPLQDDSGAGRLWI